MKKNIILVLAVLIITAGLFAPNQQVFAGDPNCQSGYTSNPYNNNPPPRRPTQEQRKFAAAQFRNAQNQPPQGGLTGGDSPTRSGFSFYLSILILFGGIWALFVLLFQRFGKYLEPKRVRLPKLLGFALKPSFALSAFGVLFLATIVGSIFNAPTTVIAEKREKPDKSKMEGVANPSNKSVFKTAQQIGGSGVTQIGAPVFDATGNRYIRGGFTGTMTIGATTLTASRDFDMFVTKYDVNGNAVWARQATGATSGIASNFANEGATALAVDSSGNVFIGGSFVKTITLQGGANTNITLNDDGAAGINYESFVAKYDANGNLLWAKGGNSSSPKNPDNLEVGQNGIDQIVFDSSGNPYITGFVSGNNFFGSAFTNQGQSEILLAKLNPADGAVVWKQIIGGTNDDNGLDLRIDGANNLYLIGNFGSPQITFPDGTTFTNPDDPNDPLEDSTDTFIAKFDTSGSNLWVEDLGNADTVGGSQIAVNAAGDIYLTGYFFDSATFPTTPETTLTENEGSGDDDDSLGGYVAKMDSGGNFIWAKSFGGTGKSIALDAAGRVYVVGTFWDGGAFGDGTPNAEMLASFDGDDVFVARYDSNGGFDWAKPIAGTGIEGLVATYATGDPSEVTENIYNPVGIAFNPATGTMFVSSDFNNVVTLDCITLKTPAFSRQSYIAELSADNEAVTCRIWNGLDADDNDWDLPDNWNGGIIPSNNNSVYIPYTGNSFDNPTYNPATNVILQNITVADDRTLTFGDRDLILTGKLWLTGGIVNTGDRLIDMVASATANRIADLDGNGGYVIGNLRKEFGDQNPFTFPVGTANGYSPVDVAPQNGSGALLKIKAVEQPHPMTANTTNHINRYWNINQAGKGFIEANLTFHYLQTDVVGDESLFKLYKIDDPDPPEERTATIDTEANTATVNNVSEFSDWTLANLAPSAASVSVGGQITMPNGYGISGAIIVLTDDSGNTQRTISNSFGYFQFEEVEGGKTYTLSVRHRRFTFAPQIINVFNTIDNLQIVSGK